MELRSYQIEALERLRKSYLSGKRRIILHAPTGAGKTVMASTLIKFANEKGNKVLFLANRRELIFQATETLMECGLDPGTIMAGTEHDLRSDVQVASMQTYTRRIKLDDIEYNPWWHNAKLIIVDECHGSISPSYKEILNTYGDDVVTIGLTATPCRGDGRGLGEYYQEIVSTADVKGLIEQDYLVPVRYFAPSKPDLEKIKITAGDYNKKELEKRTNTSKLVGDIVENWLRIASDRQTIIFATGVRHSVHIVERFQAFNIKAEHVDAKTPTEERKQILNRLKSGDTQIVSNVGILTEGFDFPAASCIVLARPTKSMGLYLQMAGRGLRPFNGKQDLVLIDHGGCIEEHGFLDEERMWTLDGKKKAWSKTKSESKPSMVKCIACHKVFEKSNKCPDCGTEVQTFGKKVNCLDAELEELKPSTLNRKKSWSYKCKVMAGLKWYARKKGYREGWYKHAYREIFGVWPNDDRVRYAISSEPDKEVWGIITHLNIKRAKTYAKNRTGTSEAGIHR